MEVELVCKVGFVVSSSSFDAAGWISFFFILILMPPDGLLRI
jgi:hypothetical protein